MKIVVDAVKLKVNDPNLCDREISKMLICNKLMYKNKACLTDQDKVILVKVVASVRSHFNANHPSGLTYFGYELTDYQDTTKQYSDIQMKFNE